MKTKLFNLKLKMIKHSPEILTGVGIAGFIGSSILAVRAGVRLQPTLVEAKNKWNIIVDREADETDEEYTPEMAKDLKKAVITYTAFEITKEVYPVLGLVIVSTGCLMASNSILRKRVLALGAAYTTTYTAFEEYRQRVTDRFGKDVEHEIKYNIRKEKISETETDPETGKEKTVKKTVNVLDENSLKDPYTFIFDERCAGWVKDHSYNTYLLNSEQSYANDILKARGHLFMNEILDRLGIERTKAGQIVGWVYNPENKDADNYVDFRANEVYIDAENGPIRKIVLNFNVDGNVLELI